MDSRLNLQAESSQLKVARQIEISNTIVGKSVTDQKITKKIQSRAAQKLYRRYPILWYTKKTLTFTGERLRTRLADLQAKLDLSGVKLLSNASEVSSQSGRPEPKDCVETRCTNDNERIVCGLEATASHYARNLLVHGQNAQATSSSGETPPTSNEGDCSNKRGMGSESHGGDHIGKISNHLTAFRFHLP